MHHFSTIEQAFEYFLEHIYPNLSPAEKNKVKNTKYEYYKEGVKVSYIKEILKSNIGQKSLERLKRPVARANINLAEIATIQIPLPPVETQNKIAEKINQIRVQAQKLQQEAKAVLETAKKEVEQMILGEG